MKPTRRPEQGRLLALERATSDHRIGIWAPRSTPGQTAKNHQGTHFRVAPNNRPSAPRGKRLRLPCAAKLLRAASDQTVFDFLEIVADGRIAIAHRGPRGVVILYAQASRGQR